MALLVMCLSHKHEDLVLIPRMCVKVVVAVPSTRGGGRQKPAPLTSQSSQMDEL